MSIYILNTLTLFTTLFVFFWGSIGSVLGQEALADTSQARKHMETAANFREMSKYDSTIVYYEKARSIYENHLGANHPLVADCMYSMSWVYRDLGAFDKAIKAMEYSLAIRSKSLQENPLKIANSYNGLGLFHKDYGKYIQGIPFLHKAISMYRTMSGKDYINISSAYNNLGILYKHIGDYDSALYYLHKTLEIDIENYGKEHLWVGYSYHNIGSVYATIENHEESISHREEAYNIIKKNRGNSHPDLCLPLNGIGSTYLAQGKLSQAKEYLQRALNIYKQLDYQHPDELLAQSNMGNIYSNLKQYNQALEYYKQGLQLAKRLYDKQHRVYTQNFNNIAVLHMDLKQYDQAYAYLDSCLILFQTYPDIHSLEKVLTYNNLSTLYEDIGQYDKALKALSSSIASAHNIIEEYPEILIKPYYNMGSVYGSMGKLDKALISYQKVLWMYDNELDSLNISQNPRIGSIKVDATLMSALHQKALILQKKYNQTQNSEYLIQALYTYETAIEVNGLVRKNHSRRESKEALQEEVFPIYNDAIATAFHLWEETDQKHYLEKAYLFSEKSKSVLLHEAVQETYARTNSNLPDSLIKEETSLRLFLAHFEKELVDQQTLKENINPEKISHLQNKVFYYRRSHDSLLQVIAQKYPNYYQLMYDREVASANEIQDFLPNSSTLVQYFWGDSSMYIFMLTSNDISVSEHKISKTFKDSLETFIAQFADIEYVGKNLYNNQVFQAYIQYASALYQSLLGEYLPSNTKQLLIIPDGLLSHMPFELLLTKTPKASAVDYSSLSYLINKFKVRYEYSSTLLNLQTFHKKGERYFAGFAPTYDKGYNYISETSSKNKNNLSQDYLSLRNGLSPLRYNQPEVEEIANMLTGDVFLGWQATESNFKANSSNYRLLHLAMHTVLDDSLPLYSGLVFSENQDSLDDGYLYTSEIYNLSLNADLAILSACETGIGKMLRGEGMMSIARAFKYAGTPNIVTSLWKVDDEATKNLMKQFYDYLQQGLPKDQALQQAKLDQIAKGGKYAHPAFWSAFVLIGDDKPIQNNFSMAYLFVGLLLIGLIVFVAFRKMNVV